MAQSLLIAGHETTASQIPNLIYQLLTHPDQLATLRADLDLIPRAVEELLRFTPLGAGGGQPRYALEDVELGGVTVRAGEPVIVAVHSANRDETVFTRPDELDLTRQGASHVAFGHGAHHCLGAPLARMELQVTLHTLLTRLPGLRLTAEDDIVWKTGLSTVEALRRKGYTGRITVVGAEPYAPYDRPPLSKQASSWVTRRSRWLRPAEPSAQRPATTCTPTRSSSPPECGPAPLPRPGRRGRCPCAAHTRRFTGPAQGPPVRTRLVVVGEGVLGAEIAATARTLGVDVTIAGPLHAPPALQVGPLVSGLLADLHEGRVTWNMPKQTRLHRQEIHNIAQHVS